MVNWLVDRCMLHFLIYCVIMFFMVRILWILLRILWVNIAYFFFFIHFAYFVNMQLLIYTLNPFMGTLEVPVTNWSSLDLKKTYLGLFSKFLLLNFFLVLWIRRIRNKNRIRIIKNQQKKINRDTFCFFLTSVI